MLRFSVSREVGAAGMDESVYMNLEELCGAAGDWSSEHPPSHFKETSVRNKSRRSERSEVSRREKLKVIQGSEVNQGVKMPLSSSLEPEHGRRQKLCMVCVSLLCVLLLVTVTALSVQYHRDLQQLFTDLTNQTADKHLLLLRYHNLTEERDKLHATYRTVMKEAGEGLGCVWPLIGQHIIITCPYGWTQFRCSCYLLESSRYSWDVSRSMCQQKGGDLVIVTSTEEMMFLNKLGAHVRFWIGLSQTSNSLWKWTNGQLLGSNYWRSGHPAFSPRTHRCVVFNSFSTWSIFRHVKSWTTESCSQALQGVCEKEASTRAV